MNKVKGFILKQSARKGDVIALLPDGTAMVVEMGQWTNGEARTEVPPPNEQGPVEMARDKLNRLYHRTKLPEVRQRCTALYAIIWQNPSLRATDYTRLMRDAGYQLRDGIDGRQEIQRALEKLFEIEAVERSGAAKQPSYIAVR